MTFIASCYLLAHIAGHAYDMQRVQLRSLEVVNAKETTF